jgi:hypothetical protein
MAKFLMLIIGDQQRWAEMSEDEEQAIHAGHRAFAAAAGPAVLGGQELQRTGVTLRADALGRLLRTDGMFAETKEIVGGYYLIEAADIDAVAKLAEHLREVHAGHSGVEIRPVVDHG